MKTKHNLSDLRHPVW